MTAMKKIKETEKGFYGCYWPKEGAECAMIAMLGDDCEDYMTKSAVKWVQKHFGLSVLTLSPAHKDYSHINLPVERIGAAIDYLKAHGIKKLPLQAPRQRVCSPCWRRPTIRNSR